MKQITFGSLIYGTEIIKIINKNTNLMIELFGPP